MFGATTLRTFLFPRQCLRAFSCAAAPKETRGPLAGVRVLDLSRVLAGPYCSMLLADMGADVIKVERPGTGDDTRRWGPPFVNGVSSYFLCVNRNKRSVTLDFKSERGVEILKGLASASDIVIENFIPGTTQRLGIDYDTLKSVNERLIYATISGFGSHGPYKDHPGYDIMVTAMGGMMGATGHQSTGPTKVGVAVVDVATGMMASNAILAALYARQNTGVGQKLDLSLLQTQVSMMTNVASNYLTAHKEPVLRGTAHDSIVPYQAFDTLDGSMVIAVGNNQQFGRLCQCLEKPELAEDERFSTNALRVENREVLVTLINNIFKLKPTLHWEQVCTKNKIPCSPINSMRQVFDNPQVVHQGLVQEIEHPVAGPVKLVGFPGEFSGYDTPIRLPPPLLGQHNEEVLTEILNLTKADIDKLKNDEVI